jgi:hypothetical protein
MSKKVIICLCIICIVGVCFNDSVNYLKFMGLVGWISCLLNEVG